MKKHTTVYLILLTSVLCLSCARSVTPRDTTLNATFTLTFRDTPDLINNNYMIIFSNIPSPNIAIPNISTGFQEYFPTPGLSYEENNPFLNEKGLNYYYQNYFSTWSDYLLIHNKEAHFFRSNSNGFNKNTTDTYTYPEEEGFEATFSHSGTKLIIEFDLEQLRPSLSGTLYFNFAISKIMDNYETGYLLDAGATNKSILIVTIAEDSSYEIEDTSITGSADLISWKLSIL